MMINLIDFMREVNILEKTNQKDLIRKKYIHTFQKTLEEKGKNIISRDQYSNFLKNDDKYKKGICYFCDKKEIEEFGLVESNNFIIKINKFPYNGKYTHLLLYPKRCIVYTKELNENEFIEFVTIEKFFYYFFEAFAKGKYFSFVRQNGDEKSIKHLHYHYIPGEVNPNIKIIETIE